MTRRELAALPSLGLLQDLPATVRDIGSRRELFVDRYLIAEMRGVELRMATPVDAGTALVLDRPWEGPFSGYSTVIQDGARSLLYYRGLPTAGADGGAAEVTCVAESNDGLRWTRPNLRLFPQPAAAGNNIVLAGSAPFSHNFCPFRDRQGFKAIAGIHKSGLHAFTSADGFRWTPVRAEPVLTTPPNEFAFDSQNLAFWSESENQYVLYYRTWKKQAGVNYRWVSRAVSRDFVEWKKEGEVDYGDAPPEHLYTNQTSAYFRAPHLYVGICARFFPGRQVLTEAQAREVRVDPKYFQDCSDAVLVTSHGGTRFTRTFLEAFLRPGPGLENWVSRSNYPCLNLVQTGPAAMSFYVNRNYGQPTAHLRRYELRLDGFASAQAGYAGGWLLTHPLRFTGSQLELNYATSAAGSVKVTLEDPQGRAIPGFDLASAPELIGDETGRIYGWKPGQDLSRLAGQSVRLRLHLKDASVYAFRFL